MNNAAVMFGRTGDECPMVKTPKLTVGELAVLRVVDTTNIGAFLDWGLEKDLFLPFREQIVRVQKGDMCLMGLYIDSSNRLSATMNIYNLLSSDSPYKENDRVKGNAPACLWALWA